MVLLTLKVTMRHAAVQTALLHFRLLTCSHHSLAEKLLCVSCCCSITVSAVPVSCKHPVTPKCCSLASAIVNLQNIPCYLILSTIHGHNHHALKGNNERTVKIVCYRQLLSPQHREPKAAARRLLPAAQAAPTSASTSAAAGHTSFQTPATLHCTATPALASTANAAACNCCCSWRSRMTGAQRRAVALAGGAA
jgi:hypothetical protein